MGIEYQTGVWEIFRAFLKLGLISFGGPVAHISYFHAEFVVKRRWVDEAAFADLLALCNFLPGPSSSQMVFAIAMRRAGLCSALVASLCFTLPSAILMILFGCGISSLGNQSHEGWLHGLKLAAVAVVAQAVWGMGRKLCPDRPRLTFCLGAAIAILVFPGLLTQLIAIVFGAAFGCWIYRSKIPSHGESATLPLRAHAIAGACLAVFFGILFAMPIAAAIAHSQALAVFDSFYRSGSLVFGGGHVVLPLLQTEVVAKGWVSSDIFLAGYGAAQALPGPLFTFSAYLGTVMHPGPWAWLNGLWCLFAIFLPGWLLLGGSLPFWDVLRKKLWMQASLRGANAAVVGVLLAALYTPVITQGITGPRDVGFALVAFEMLEKLKVPSWLVVLASAAGGQLLLH